MKTKQFNRAFTLQPEGASTVRAYPFGIALRVEMRSGQCGWGLWAVRGIRKGGQTVVLSIYGGDARMALSVGKERKHSLGKAVAGCFR